jgi:diguanylate cyclase (GGDEF)-like protein
MKIFTKQAAISYESAVLTKRAKELEIKDDLTDLYNEKYIAERLEEEIKRALLYQRPCSYLMFNVDNFDKFRSENGELATEKALKKIASVMNKNATEIGRAARLSGDVFAVLLPEKNKKEAYKIAEDVRREVENLELEGAKVKRLTISGGVGENPIDGTSAAELMRKAAMGVSIAKSQGKNRII